MLTEKIWSILVLGPRINNLLEILKCCPEFVFWFTYHQSQLSCFGILWGRAWHWWFLFLYYTHYMNNSGCWGWSSSMLRHLIHCYWKSLCFYHFLLLLIVLLVNLCNLRTHSLLLFRIYIQNDMKWLYFYLIYFDNFHCIRIFREILFFNRFIKNYRYFWIFVKNHFLIIFQNFHYHITILIDYIHLNLILNQWYYNILLFLQNLKINGHFGLIC